MAVQQSQIQKKGLQSVPATPTSTAFQSRPFEPPQAEIQESAPNDLHAQLKPAQQSRHSFASTLKVASPIQAKLTIGQPNDKYEQEADRVAAQVVSRLHSPEPVALPKLQSKAVVSRKSLEQTLQRSQKPEEDELQMKPLANSIQRTEIPEEDELQLKPLADSIQRTEVPEEDELQMKPTMLRRRSDSAQDASVNLEASIDQARGGGQSMMDTIRQPMEQAFGANFSQVKIHTDAQSDRLNRAIQAKAFTTGQDVFFRQGAYDPGSRGGQELLAHELTHVVQQKQGGAGPDMSKQGKEESRLNQSTPSSAVQRQLVIQRMPTLNEFKASTKIDWTIRWKVTTVDTLLDNFHASAPDAYGERLAYINQIIQACQHYIGLPDDQAKRKAGVTTLLDNANNELPIYLALNQMSSAGSLREKFNKAIEAQDLAVKQENTGNTTLSATSDSIRTVLNSIVKDIEKNEPATMNLIVQDDLQRLRDMLNDNSLPQITRDVITEVLSNVNQVGLVGTKGTPGARLAKGYDNLGDKKYKVEHGVVQNMGTAERLGSLAHELTHVAAGESYDNTSSFLMFATTLTTSQLQQLGALRVNEVAALRTLCDQDTAFNAKQKQLLHSKINYGYEDKLGLYAMRFQDAGIQRLKEAEELLKKDPENPEGLRKQAEGTKYRQDERIMMAAAAAAPGQSSVFIEYETVMNQMLIYMHQWGIPQDNPFYTKLSQVAQDAYDARAAARG